MGQESEAGTAERDPLTATFTRAWLSSDYNGDCTLVDLIGLGKANASTQPEMNSQRERAKSFRPTALWCGSAAMSSSSSAEPSPRRSS